MSVNGGSDRIKYFMSLGYLHDEGMYDGIDYKRYNLRANIDAKINNYINVRLDLEGMESTLEQPQVASASLFEYVVRRQNVTIAGIKEIKRIIIGLNWVLI